ncbi:FAD-dependent thymidylate synthase [Nostoc phage N1]|nr:FAD-dependent thymidylate synthase [Nostoc phage N1]
MKVRLIAHTTGAENTEYHGKTLDEIIVGIARLSSGKEALERFKEPHKLIRHCIINGHWSIFDQVNLTFEIETSRAIGRQLIRHHSIHPQEFSQRYAEVQTFQDIELRKQSKNNRQSSTEVFDPEMTKGIYKNASDMISDLLDYINDCYKDLLDLNVSRETARLISPECATTHLIMNGTMRSWITLLNVRLHKTTQKEFRLIAEAIRNVLINKSMTVSKALYNFDNAYEIPILDRVILEKYKVYDKI